jgi:hypothetical protein
VVFGFSIFMRTTASERQLQVNTRPNATDESGPSRTLVCIGISMLAISLAGLVHKHLGLAWDIRTQLAYGAAGAAVAFTATRAKMVTRS